MKWNGNNKKWYVSKGYPFTNYNDVFIVNVNDLSKGSNYYVDVKCDGDDCKNKFSYPVTWENYLKYVKDDGKYYCSHCNKKLYNTKNNTKTRIKNGKSFEQWCIENNRQDLLDTWDYELNNCKPSEITYSTGTKHYFKCPRGIHKSELKYIHSVKSQKPNTHCIKCNSFAQWGIDSLGEDFLEKYWDYEKNDGLGIDPWEISFQSNKTIYINCQEKDYHGSYSIICWCFYKGGRCGYCNGKKVHPLDSLGKVLEDKGLLHLWSDKNKKSPYEYAPFSNKYVWWKCSEGKHKDFYRFASNFSCTECQYSKGENEISIFLLKKYLTRITKIEYNKLSNELKNNKLYYIPQMKFKKLKGINNGLLSYDFYIPKLNLLIEYQGEQHERYIPGFHKNKKDFDKQLEHDRRKKEYTQIHNINLLEIWYYDFDRIEEILNKELNIK